MNITGIIAEYNPLHKGHIYHIQNSKKITSSDSVICIMSGNFVQRGLPSIIDKWSRTKLALENGIDLVIELPLVYSLSSAEFFSFGSVSLLNSLGVVNSLSFGSECGDIDTLMEISKILAFESLEFKTTLKSFLDTGLSYPMARSKTLAILLKDKYCDININDILNNSNNILAIEYCKSLIKLNSSIIPYTIKRIGSSYNEKSLKDTFSSATSIRNYLKEGTSLENLKFSLPETSFKKIYEEFSNNTLAFEENMFPYIKYKALTSINTLDKLPDVSEGLHNKIYKELISCNSYSELINNIKSKRYTYTRISRIIAQYFLGLEEFDLYSLRSSPAPYARVLGFTKRGQEILKEIKKTTSIPIYTKLPKDKNTFLNLDIQGTNAYSLLNKSISYNADLTTSPIRLF